MFIPDPDFFPSRIQGSKSTGSRIRIRNTAGCSRESSVGQLYNLTGSGRRSPFYDDREKYGLNLCSMCTSMLITIYLVLAKTKRCAPSPILSLKMPSDEINDVITGKICENSRLGKIGQPIKSVVHLNRATGLL
jgi:hypothetical protein